MSRPNLAQTQTLLWKLITAPEGVERGLDELSAGDRELARGLVRARAPLSAVERWDIYANMYFYRLRDCVKQDFAAVAQVVGEINFHNLMTDYLLAHPPSHFSLRYAGEHLPDFLRSHELSRQRPYLADLARLEYAIVDSFDAPDSEALQAKDLRRVAPEEWPGLRLRPAPSVRLLELEWPVAEIWRQAKEGRDVSEVAPSKTHMRVWRRGHRVFHKAVEEREADALTALLHGAAFEEMCAIVGKHAGEEEGAPAALAILQAWLAEEVLCTAGDPPA